MNETKDSTDRIAAIEVSLGGLTGKVDTGFARVDERFQRVDERFQQVDERFQQVDERFQQVDERFQQVDERFQQVDEHFVAINETLADHGRRLDAIEGHFPDLHAYIEFGFGELGRRMEDGFKETRRDVRRLEARFDGLENRFERLETKLDRLIDVISPPR